MIGNPFYLDRRITKTVFLKHLIMIKIELFSSTRVSLSVYCLSFGFRCLLANLQYFTLSDNDSKCTYISVHWHTTLQIDMNPSEKAIYFWLLLW